MYRFSEPDAPGKFPPYLEGVPMSLRRLDQWMGTRFKRKPDGGLDKPPYRIRRGLPVLKMDKTSPEAWGSFEEAVEALRVGRVDAIGFCLSELDCFSATDLDGCFTEPGGVLEEWAREYVEALPTYWEISASGTGLHAICEGEKPGPRCRRGSVELYSRDRFLVTTGRHLEGTPADVRPCQEGLDRVYRMVFGQEEASQDAAPAEPPPGSSLEDREIPERVARSKHGEKFARLWNGDISGYESRSHADLALCGILAFWTGGDAAQIERLFYQSGLCRPKWTKRADYRERTIRKVLEGKTEFFAPPRLTVGSAARLRKLKRAKVYSRHKEEARF